jgi:predicted secreted Zn-dependent protease
VGEILWIEGERLTWDNFRGTPTDTIHAAKISYEISYSVCKKSIWNGKVVLKVECIFHQNVSWVSRQMLHPLLLRHEQLHFDIAELYTRKLRKEFEDSKLNVDTVEKKASSIFDKVDKECLDYQRVYDKETYHGTIEDKQIEWELKIKDELKALENYKKNHC